MSGHDIDDPDGPDPAGVRQSLLSHVHTHLHREALYQEIHARPSPLIRPPVRASSMVFLDENRGRESAFEHVCRLARRFGANLPDPEATCYYQEMGGFELRWERHTEFCSYTFIRPGGSDPPFADTALSVLPQDWLESMPGTLLTGVHVTMVPTEGPDPFGPELPEWFEGQTLFGSRIVDERARVFTTLRLHSDGFSRILVCNTGLSEFQSGRTLQRLLELEVYRTMALLGLPDAKDIGPRAARLDRQLAEVMDEFGGLDNVSEERRLLDELTSLAAEVERYRSATNQRFAATRAYHELVTRRLEDLREIKFSGMSTIGKFLERRLGPAIRTCQAVEDQLESLSRRIDRATDLLQAKVDVAIESQNLQVLAEMNRRAQLQLRLQQTVEGLSVAAISYYTVGLIKYALEGAASWGLPLRPTLGAGITVPFVIAAVWWTVRRIRQRVEEA